MGDTHMNNQLFISVKHSRTCDHLNVEFEIPALVRRINSMVWIFSSTDSHFASTGELGRNMTSGTKTTKVRMAQMI